MWTELRRITKDGKHQEHLEIGTRPRNRREEMVESMERAGMTGERLPSRSHGRRLRKWPWLALW